VDCSLQVCRLLDRWCTSCNASSCLGCEEGWYLDSRRSSGVCSPCSNFDPRCGECSESEGCLSCADPILTGQRRSGRRRRDPPLPFDEDTRMFRGPTPVGDQSSTAFDSAEVFILSSKSSKWESIGAKRGAWSPGRACLDAQGMGSTTSAPASSCPTGVGSGQRIRVSVADGIDPSGLPAVYDINCERPVWGDAYYGFGASGEGGEGPVRDASYGSHLSPVVYPPGVASSDDGAGLVSVTGNRGSGGSDSPPSRLVDMTVEYLQAAVLAAQLEASQWAPSVRPTWLGGGGRTWNETAVGSSSFAPLWVFGGMGPLVTGPGINTERWGDYEGYRRDSVRGWLLSNETGAANAWGFTGEGTTHPYLACTPGQRGVVAVCDFYPAPPRPSPASGYTGAAGATPSPAPPGTDSSFLNRSQPFIYYLPKHYVKRLRQLAEVAWGATGGGVENLKGGDGTASPRRPQLGGRALFQRDSFLATPSPQTCTNATLSAFPTKPSPFRPTPQSNFNALPTPYLNSTAFACTESGWGSWGDAGSGNVVWKCERIPISNAVCGHPGGFSFSSPRYVAVEGVSPYLPITVMRSGGGLGRSEVTLSLGHGTTDDSDVSLGGGGSRTLVFEEGVVSLTLRVAVHNDAEVEPGIWMGGGEASRIPSSPYDLPFPRLPPALAPLLDPLTKRGSPSWPSSSSSYPQFWAST